MNPSGETEVLKPHANTATHGLSHASNEFNGMNLSNYESSQDFEPSNSENSQSESAQNGMTPYSAYYGYSYDPFLAMTGPFTTQFPRAKDYSNMNSIVEAFPHLQKLNDSEFDLESIPSDAHFYILRSSNDDNIHKSIKYQSWTSTPSGKNVLKKAWNEFQAKGKEAHIYLIFSVVSSNQFLGVAKMQSDIDDNESFKFWWEPCKWFGTFKVSWLFVKDIHHSKFEEIIEESANNSVVNLKDGMKISAVAGKQMLKVFKEHVDRPSIFDFFEYMDRREDYIRMQRDNNPEFDRYFKEYCEAYKRNPDIVFPQKRHFYGNRKPQYRKPMSVSSKKFNSNANGSTTYSNGTYANGNGFATQKVGRPESTKNINLEEQFIVRTESEKLNKINKQAKKAAKKAAPKEISNDFFEMGKKVGNFKNYQEENPEENE